MCTDEPRKRLIDAALDLFGRYSFDGVSTRMLAEKAEVNLAAIKYYFGSKEGLYIAVAQYIVEQFNTMLDRQLEKIREALTDQALSRERSFHYLCELLDFLITRFLGLPQSDQWLGIIIREQLCPTKAFDTLFEGFMKPLDNVLFGLTARIVGLDSEDQEVKLRVFAIVGQIMMFHISPSGIRRTLAWENYGPENLDAIRSVIMSHLSGIFSMPPPSDSDTGAGCRNSEYGQATPC
ncbi:MAG: CerR family C-terminal domain-containing protein [Pseudomonadota bacterium]